MYARGMSVREIAGHVRELYGVDVSPDLISTVTDAVLEELAAWQARPPRGRMSPITVSPNLQTLTDTTRRTVAAQPFRGRQPRKSGLRRRHRLSRPRPPAPGRRRLPEPQLPLRCAEAHHMMQAMMRETTMRTTVTLDDALVARAEDLCGVKERGALLREALKALIEREAARRLARLGGAEPELGIAPRRRPA
jgi:Arc/MetJ family transcription regulator